MEREKSNGCTVHFNSILQLLIYKPQSINKTLIKLEISKEASFFFYSFVFLIFLLHLNSTRVFFSLLFKLLLDHTSVSFYFRSIQHISLPGCFEIKRNETRSG